MSQSYYPGLEHPVAINSINRLERTASLPNIPSRLACPSTAARDIPWRGCDNTRPDLDKYSNHDVVYQITYLWHLFPKYPSSSVLEHLVIHHLFTVSTSASTGIPDVRFLDSRLDDKSFSTE
ncbi:hypothetical protein ANN_03734 [Periplaneta americana]|uniref:Uncharacterized protein n=1 Tax=Periplaneta americana TaxID=6978 RepID=A0ABQ8TZM9_PERAM|nr:hypothetical protein ANN_03734 [Periplaneta americana]